MLDYSKALSFPHSFIKKSFILYHLGSLMVSSVINFLKSSWVVRLHWAVILAAVIYINYIVFKLTFGNICIYPDSWGYLSFAGYRTAGYPIILKMLQIIFGDLRALILFQLNFILGAFLILGYAVGRLINSPFLGRIFILVAFSITPILQTSYEVLTEATFTAFLCLHFAAIGFYFKKPSLKYGILSGTTAIIAILIRPAGYPLIAGIVILLLFLPKHRKLTSLSFGIPILLGILMGTVINAYKHGDNLYPFGTVSLLTQATFVLHANDGKGTEYEELIHKIVEKNEPLVTKVRNSFDFKEYWLNIQATYNTIFYSNNGPLLTEYISKKYPNHAFYKKMDTAGKNIIFIGITSNPLSYAKHVLAGYLGMWRNFFYGSSTMHSHASLCYESTKNLLAEYPPYKEYVDPSRFTEDKAIKYKELQFTQLDRVWYILFLFFRYAVVICSILSLVLVFFNFRRNDPAVYYIFYATVLSNLYFLFVASLGIAIPRYVNPFIPIFYSMIFVVVFLILRHIYSKKHLLTKFIKHHNTENV